MSLLQVEELEKSFGTHRVLDKISLSFEPGKVYGLLGENGAGKSTFIKLLTGVNRPDKGRLLWKGQEVELHSPSDARKIGINVVHQHRNIISFFTGLENVYLGSPYPRFRWWPAVDWGSMRSKVKNLMDELNFKLPLDIEAQQMSPADHTLLEIVRAMMQECELLFLDEPTAALTEKETVPLFQLIHRLREKGTAIVYVSHRLDEIFELCDEIIVLRNGILEGTFSKNAADENQVVSLMAGSTGNLIVRESISDKGENRGGSLEAEEKLSIRRQEKEIEAALLEVEQVSTSDHKVKNASFRLNSGEILGIFGLTGAGRTELLEAIYGLRQAESGKVIIKGKVVKKPSPVRSIKQGIVLVPEERLIQGIIPAMSLRENMTLSMLSSFSYKGVLHRRKEKKVVEEHIAKLKLKAESTEQPIFELSGGNQQKVVFARSLISAPEIYLCDEPTQGVDVGTREEIHQLLRNEVKKDKGVLYVSSDLKELLYIADRLVVMREGETVAELPVERLTYETVLQYCYGKVIE